MLYCSARLRRYGGGGVMKKEIPLAWRYLLRTFDTIGGRIGGSRWFTRFRNVGIPVHVISMSQLFP
uniref:Uncharacterized protein n=1 Tax=Timema tahoe TaxID=61484 RepID=A0A7R9FKU0_9NEOP|nr:unnamed protein product [Timema tahoe]